MKFWLWAGLKKIWGPNSKIGLLEDLSNLVVSIPAKFEGCAAKIVGGVGFFSVTGFFQKSTIANFHLTVASMTKATSNFANRTTTNLECYI